MVTFDTDEYVIHVAHKHWWIFAVRFVILAILAVLPIFILPVLGFVTSISENQIFRLFTFGYSIYLLILWMILFLTWTDYYLDMAVITNKRIIYVEQKGLFSREVSTMRFETIQDITTYIEGVVQTLFRYGDLYIQTAATTREFVLDDIAKPDEVKELISRELSRIVDKTDNI